MNDAAISLAHELFLDPGYSTCCHLTSAELYTIREIINRLFVNRLSKFVTVPDGLTANRYHELSLQDHSVVWTKTARFVPRQDVELIKEFGFLKDIEAQLGRFSISKRVDERGKVYDEEEIYWRLVRPFAETDIGPLHADIWFADALKYDQAVIGGKETLKAWIPIYVEPAKNGLSVVANSHKQQWAYEVVDRGSGPRPSILSDVQGELLVTEPGQIVLFGEHLLHGGALNTGDNCRVSIEITLVFDEPISSPFNSVVAG